jgi:hypothetical protein
MIVRAALLAVAGLSMSVFASAQTALPPGGAKPVQSCDYHKFETRIAAEVDGKLRSSTVRICGQAGQTDEDWRRTLVDSMNKVEANEKMAPAVKTQIVDALKLEIAKLDTANIRPSTGGSLATAIPGLTPLPKGNSIGAPLTPVRPGNSAPARPLEQDYGSLKPLPAPPPPVVVSLSNPVPVALAAPPRLTLLCSSPSDPHGADECDDVGPSTTFTVRADEPLKAGDTSLRFMRKGDARGDVTLAAMRKGQTMRVGMPSGVCSGFTRGTLEVQVMRRASASAPRQVVDVRGPYLLRC